jgi:alanine racemase
MIENKLRTWVEISQQALLSNYNYFRNLINSKCKMMAVVKSNAYGHGLIEYSKIVEKFGVDWFGVDSIVEAEKLRKEGINKPILVLGHTLLEKIPTAIKNNISLTVSDIDSLKKLKNIGINKYKLKVHLKIDTGMHRQGFFVSELPKVIKIIKSLNNFLIIEGVYTHFSCAHNPNLLSVTRSQIKEFKKALEILYQFGFKNLIKHAASTAGTIVFPESHFDLVRLGIGLYGLWPSKEVKIMFGEQLKLKPVLSWKTIIGQIKNLSCGCKIGYDLSETLKRDSKVAILPVGYWHGFPRHLSSIGWVLINGNKAKVLGRVSMDMIVVDVTDIKKIRNGDQVVLLGRSGKFINLADDLADLSNTINYEIITRINPLIKRIITI